MKRLLSAFLFGVFFTLLSCGRVPEDKPGNCELVYQNTMEGIERSDEESEVIKIRYFSDGYEIEGFIVKPKTIAKNSKLPVIIYNRGGNRDYGKLTMQRIEYFKELSSFGYAIVASQYRGNMNSEGFDQFGGNDVNDLLCLIDIIKQLDFLDNNRIGVLGYSRGGLMAYRLSQESDDIDAVVTIGGLTDLLMSSKNRPSLYYTVYKELIGDSIDQRDEYIKRSAIYWANQIDAPTLILHGENDSRVNILNSIKLVDSLEKYGKTIMFKKFEHGNHSLSNYSEKRDSLIIGWFNEHLKQ